MAEHEFRDREHIIYMTEEEARSMSNYYELTGDQREDFWNNLEEVVAEEKKDEAGNN